MEFQPGIFFAPTNEVSTSPPASLIILNQPLPSFSIFEKLWTHTTFRICADGGANRLFDLFNSISDETRQAYTPDIIVGDLDSLRTSTRLWYSERGGSLVVEDGDQYSTDFGKAMKVLTGGYSHLADLPGLPTLENGALQDIIILGTISGRVDQGLGLLHEIYRESRSHSAKSATPVRMWLFSEQSVSFLLHEGRNVIAGVNPKDSIFTPNVGILPIFGPAVISTKGLEWDVQNWETQMGGQVSTSNHVMGDEVVVETNGTVLFTIELSGQSN